MKKILHLILLTLTIVGALMLFGQQKQHTVLRARYDRLVTIHGALRIDDSSRFAIRRVPTDDNTFYKWQIHCPENQSVEFHGGFSFSGAVSGTRGWTQSQRIQQLCRFELSENRISTHFLGQPAAGRFDEQRFRWSR
ncbi:MAG: hypothetical protein HKN47_11115, partial [Pirellulaceae bacterium]|nr:hypothetical protein [Pirellulaceae bacterium]